MQEEEQVAVSQKEIFGDILKKYKKSLNFENIRLFLVILNIGTLVCSVAWMGLAFLQRSKTLGYVALTPMLMTLFVVYVRFKVKRGKKLDKYYQIASFIISHATVLQLINYSYRRDETPYNIAMQILIMTLIEYVYVTTPMKITWLCYTMVINNLVKIPFMHGRPTVILFTISFSIFMLIVKVGYQRIFEDRIYEQNIDSFNSNLEVILDLITKTKDIFFISNSRVSKVLFSNSNEFFDKGIKFDLEVMLKKMFVLKETIHGPVTNALPNFNEEGMTISLFELLKALQYTNMLKTKLDYKVRAYRVKNMEDQDMAGKKKTRYKFNTGTTSKSITLYYDVAFSIDLWYNSTVLLIYMNEATDAYEKMNLQKVSCQYMRSKRQALFNVSQTINQVQESLFEFHSLMKNKNKKSNCLFNHINDTLNSLLGFGKLSNQVGGDYHSMKHKNRSKANMSDVMNEIRVELEMYGRIHSCEIEFNFEDPDAWPLEMEVDKQKLKSSIQNQVEILAQVHPGSRMRVIISRDEEDDKNILYTTVLLPGRDAEAALSNSALSQSNSESLKFQDITKLRRDSVQKILDISKLQKMEEKNGGEQKKASKFQIAAQRKRSSKTKIMLSSNNLSSSILENSRNMSEYIDEIVLNVPITMGSKTQKNSQQNNFGMQSSERNPINSIEEIKNQALRHSMTANNEGGGNDDDDGDDSESDKNDGSSQSTPKRTFVSSFESSDDEYLDD